MNKELRLSSVIMRKKPYLKSGHNHRIFDNLPRQDFKVIPKIKYGVRISHIGEIQMANLDTIVQLLIGTIEQ